MTGKQTPCIPIILAEGRNCRGPSATNGRAPPFRLLNEMIAALRQLAQQNWILLYAQRIGIFARTPKRLGKGRHIV